MVRNNKNIRPSLSGFLRYLGKRISNSERNAFERELQKDPFAEEADEGFEGMSPLNLKRDMKILRQKMRRRTGKRSTVVFYRIAASIAVLMIISSIFIIVQRNKRAEPVSQILIAEKQFEIPISPALSKPESKDESKITLNTERAADKTKNAVPLPQVVKDEEVRAVSKTVVPPATVTEHNYIRGKIISSEDNLPIPGANITVKGTTIGTLTDSAGDFILAMPDSTKRLLVASFIGMQSKEVTTEIDSTVKIILNPSSLALSEIVVVGYGVQKRNATVGAAAPVTSQVVNTRSTYSPPQPENGKENFDKYIEDNMRRPAGTGSGQREVVVVSFTVKSSGVIENLKIIRSPGKVFSDEALRLIKEGPAWKPAQENGNRIDDEVRIRIVFK